MNVHTAEVYKARLAALVEAGGDVVDDAYPVAHGDAHCRVSQALIDTLRTALAAARAAPAPTRPVSDAPCDRCGYNGPNYYQPSVHACAAPAQATCETCGGRGKRLAAYGVELEPCPACKPAQATCDGSGWIPYPPPTRGMRQCPGCPACGGAR